MGVVVPVRVKVRVDLGVIAMKEYSTFPKAPRLEPHHQMVYFYIQDTYGKSLTLLQRYSKCILQSQPTQLKSIKKYQRKIKLKNSTLKYFPLHQQTESLQ